MLSNPQLSSTRCVAVMILYAYALIDLGHKILTTHKSARRKTVKRLKKTGSNKTTKYIRRKSNKINERSISWYMSSMVLIAWERNQCDIPDSKTNWSHCPGWSLLLLFCLEQKRQMHFHKGNSVRRVVTKPTRFHKGIAWESRYIPPLLQKKIFDKSKIWKKELKFNLKLEESNIGMVEQSLRSMTLNLSAYAPIFRGKVFYYDFVNSNHLNCIL